MTEWNNGPAVAAEVEVTATPEVQLTVDEKNALIKHWLDDKAAANERVELEKASRQKVTTALFPTPKKGTQRYVSPEGFGAIKLVFGWTYSLGDRDKIGGDGLKVSVKDQVDDLLTDIENLGPRGKLIADRIVKWKPELNVAEYEMLAASTEPEDVEAKTLIDAMLEVKPASPQLTFEPPKEKK